MATRKQPKTERPERKYAGPGASVSKPANAGYVKPVPKKPANERQAKELQRLQVVAQIEAQAEQDAADPATARKRKLKEKREIAKIAALQTPVVRGVYIPAYADAICERMIEGEDLSEILRDLGVKFGEMCNWMKRHPQFAAQFSTARESQAHLFISQIANIADRATGKGELARLQIDTRKWLASKLLNKLYGDRIVHAGDGDNPIVTKLVSDSADLVAKIKQVES
jgi:hypothetical protein